MINERPHGRVFPKLIVRSAFAALFFIGLASAAIGPSLPLIATFYNLTWDSVSVLFSAQFGGKIIAIILVASVGKSWPPGRMAMIGGLLFGLGLIFAASGLPWLFLLAWMTLFGLGHGALDVGLNAIFSGKLPGLDNSNTARGQRLNKLHMWFGIGAFASPGFVALFHIRTMSWQWPWIIIGALGILFTIVFWQAGAHRLKADTPAVGIEPPGSPPSLRTRTSGRMVQAGVATSLFISFLYGGMETALGGWIYTFLREGGFAFSKTFATGSVTCFWLLLALGRFVSVSAVRRTSPARWLTILSGTLFASLFLALILPQVRWLSAFVVLTGFGLSGLLPTMIGWATASVSEQLHARLIAWLLGGSALGAITVPWLVGLLASFIHIRAGFLFLGLLAAVVFIAVRLLVRIDRVLKQRSGTIGPTGTPGQLSVRP